MAEHLNTGLLPPHGTFHIKMRSVKVQVLLLCSSVLCLVQGNSFSGRDSPSTSIESWEDVCPHTICQGVTEGRLINNSMSCAAYFACVQGRAWSGECSDGTWFNYAEQICDLPWRVPCDAEASEIVELECVPEPNFIISCRNDNDLHTIQHPFDCTQYYLCMEGHAMLRSCAPGLEFSAEMSQCMVPAEAACKFGECPSYNRPLTFLSSTTNCSEFSICLNGEPVQHSCADGLHWDPDHEWCTFPDETNCEVSHRSPNKLTFNTEYFAL